MSIPPEGEEEEVRNFLEAPAEESLPDLFWVALGGAKIEGWGK